VKSFEKVKIKYSHCGLPAGIKEFSQNKNIYSFTDIFPIIGETPKDQNDH
jgi:hypothetical protein